MKLMIIETDSDRYSQNKKVEIFDDVPLDEP